MNVYTAMLLLSFIAVSTGCLILALDLFFRCSFREQLSSVFAGS